jgi:hypothetical protein
VSVRPYPGPPTPAIPVAAEFFELRRGDDLEVVRLPDIVNVKTLERFQWKDYIGVAKFFPTPRSKPSGPKKR